MDKQDLLDKIESLELSRLNSLTREQLVSEAQEWFYESDDAEDIAQDSDHRLKTDLMESFMSWRQDDSVEELQEKINNYKNLTTK